MDFGNGFGFWNTIPTRARSCTTSCRLAWMSLPSSRIDPSTRALGIVSVTRFRQCSTGDSREPVQPEEVVLRGGDADRLERVRLAVIHVRLPAAEDQVLDRDVPGRLAAL